MVKNTYTGPAEGLVITEQHFSERPETGETVRVVDSNGDLDQDDSDEVEVDLSKLDFGLTEDRIRCLELLGNDGGRKRWLPTKEITAQLENSDSAVRNYLRDFREAGLVEREGPGGRGGHRYTLAIESVDALRRELVGGDTSYIPSHVDVLELTPKQRRIIETAAKYRDLTEKSIAELAGASRPTVTRVLKNYDMREDYTGDREVSRADAGALADAEADETETETEPEAEVEDAEEEGETEVADPALSDTREEILRWFDAGVRDVDMLAEGAQTSRRSVLSTLFTHRPTEDHDPEP